MQIVFTWTPLGHQRFYLDTEPFSGGSRATFRALTAGSVASELGAEALWGVYASEMGLGL